MKQFPQLRMRHSLSNLCEARELPSGFVLRAATVRDASGLASVLDSAFREVDERWDSERAIRELMEDASVPETYVVEHDGSIVATASYQIQKEPDPEAGWVHWVGVHIDARGLGLGEIVSHRVLVEAIERGRSCVYLTTDDFRLPAIKVYLRLGFEPDCWHESHAGRWEKVLLSTAH